MTSVPAAPGSGRRARQGPAVAVSRVACAGAWSTTKLVDARSPSQVRRELEEEGEVVPHAPFEVERDRRQPARRAGRVRHVQAHERTLDARAIGELGAGTHRRGARA